MSSSASASRPRRRSRRTGALPVLAAVLALAVRPAFAAQDVPAPQAGAIVDRVVVRVDGRPGDAGLLDLVPIRAGDVFSARLVDQAVKQMFKTGLFADVRVTKQGAERLELDFDLVRNVFIDAVRFRGSRASRTRLLEGLTAQRPGAYLTEDRLPDAISEVKDGLRKEGYFDAVVTCEIRRKAGATTADLVFRVLDWKSFRIGGLEVEWKAEIPERALFKAMKSRVGDIYVPNRLAADFEALKRGLDRAGYRRAEVRLAGESFDEQNRRVDLVVEIVPQEKVTIVVSGAKVPTRLLAPIWAERVYEPWGLAEGEARILNHLRRQGYVYATVQSRVEKGRDEMRVVHDITPGGKFKVLGVDFRGNAAFSSLDLKNRLAVSKGVPIFAFISYDRLFSVPRDLESLYKENGFAGVQVRLGLARERAGVRAVFEIEEGPKSTVEAVRIVGATLVPDAELRAGILSREGGPFYQPNVQRDVGQIETVYLNRGVRGTAVAARIERSPENRITLVYEVAEGSPVTIKDIFVTGNRVTRNKVIRRELRVEKGGQADYAGVQESRRRLEALGIFSQVRVDEVGTGPGEEVVVVTVREGEVNYTGLGLGLQTLNPVSGSLADWPSDFRPRGTAEYIRSNVLGLGAQLGLLGQLSTIERRAVASWSQSYLFGLTMPTTIQAWAEREARESFTLNRRGVSVSLFKGLRGSRLLIGTVSLTRTSLSDVDIDNPPEDIDRQFLPYSGALFSLSMSWERRDDTLNPNRGYYIGTVGEVGLPLFRTESNYQKIFLKGQVFQPLTSGLTLDMTARLGLGNGLIHLPERFFAGGSNTFRGEEFEMLGPLDAETLKPYGGEAVLLINTELTLAPFASWNAFRLAGFFDLGNVYESLRDLQPFDLRGAAGAGLRYKTPLGPVRVEIAWKLWGFDAQDRRGRPLIFLTIGNIF
jgi:outer membrane protein assembly complex protein YaeT